jgi:hypothetical protein
MGLVWGWDQMRVWQGGRGFWQVGVAGYGGLRLIWPHELAPRLEAWWSWLRYLLGSPLLAAILAVGAGVLVRRALRRRDWPGLFDLLLMGSGVIYWLAHWLWAFPVWDRYLLPVALLVGMLLGRVVSVLTHWAGTRLGTSWRRPVVAAAWVSLVVLCAVPAGRALAGQVPVGAGQEAYDGIDQVAEFLSRRPPGTVLYHHWLGWEYGFYLFDAPLYMAYWPDPSWLAQDALAFGPTGPRYIVFPAWEASDRVAAALRSVGYGLQLEWVAPAGGDTVRFRVYRIVEVAE